MRIYIQKYNKYKRNIQDSGHDDLYVMVQLSSNFEVELFVRGRFQGSYYCSSMKFCMRIYIYNHNRNTV